jgi:hypothetical protein
MSLIPQSGVETELQEALERVRQLLEAGSVEEARAVAREMVVRWPEAAIAQQTARVLAPPRVISSNGPPVPSRDRERAWLKAHAHEHPGCWLAVYEDRLVGAHADFREVIRQVRESIGQAEAVLFFQSASPP